MKALRKITAALLALICVFSLSGCIAEDIINDLGIGSKDKMSGREIYEHFMEGIQSFADKFVFQNADEKQVVQVYDSIIDAHPEFFWLGNGYESLWETKGNDTKVTFSPVVLDDMAKVRDSYYNEFHSCADRIINEAKGLSSDYEKVLFVHDIIINNTEYDLSAAEQISSSQSDNKLFFEATAYGCLVEREAVCSGYSAAFQYIMNSLGIECSRVSGHGMNGESHQWNLIKLDGEDYYIDLTWDDPVTEDGGDNLTYDYFLITTEELLLTHTIGKDESVPICNAAKYNYFVYNGLFLEKYSFTAMENIIEAHEEEGQVSVKFTDKTQLARASAELFDGSRIFDIEAISKAEGSIYYRQSSNGLILTVYW